MADLSAVEKRHLAHLLGVGSGHVLNFSSSTFAQLVFDTVGRDLCHARYDHGSSHSTANRLRGFRAKEGNHVVGQRLTNRIERAVSEAATPANPTLVSSRRGTAPRLLQGGPVTEPDARAAPAEDRDFEVVARAVRDPIEQTRKEVGLDRLHTFVATHVRSLGERPDAPAKGLGAMVRSLTLWGGGLLRATCWLTTFRRNPRTRRVEIFVAFRPAWIAIHQEAAGRSGHPCTRAGQTALTRVRSSPKRLTSWQALPTTAEYLPVFAHCAPAVRTENPIAVSRSMTVGARSAVRNAATAGRLARLSGRKKSYISSASGRKPRP